MVATCMESEKAMVTVTIEIPPEVYQRLSEEAGRQGKSVEAVATDWLAIYTPPAAPPLTERARARAVLQAAGLLTELSPEEKERARQTTATLEEVQAAFARTNGKPLSEIVIEQRGPKE